MTIIFNLLIIGLVLLIAYWWANEGLFSSILHLVCVIAVVLDRVRRHSMTTGAVTLEDAD